MFPSKAMLRKSFLTLKATKPKIFHKKILFFELFAPSISKDIFKNLRTFRQKNLKLKSFTPKIRKSKIPPK